VIRRIDVDGDAKLSFAEFQDFIMSQINSASPFMKENPEKQVRNSSPIKHKRPKESGRNCAGVNLKGRPCKKSVRATEFETPSVLSTNIHNSIQKSSRRQSRSP
jgi:hypothetical protein